METGLVKELIETSMKILNENEKVRDIYIILKIM